MLIRQTLISFIIFIHRSYKLAWMNKLFTYIRLNMNIEFHTHHFLLEWPRFFVNKKYYLICFLFVAHYDNTKLGPKRLQFQSYYKWAKYRWKFGVNLLTLLCHIFQRTDNTGNAALPSTYYYDGLKSVWASVSAKPRESSAAERPFRPCFCSQRNIMTDVDEFSSTSERKTKCQTASVWFFVVFSWNCGSTCCAVLSVKQM